MLNRFAFREALRFYSVSKGIYLKYLTFLLLVIEEGYNGGSIHKRMRNHYSAGPTLP